MKLRKIIMPLFAFSLVFTGCSRTPKFEDEDITFEYGEKIYQQDLRDLITNPDLVPESTVFKVDGKNFDEEEKYSIGEHTLSFKFNDETIKTKFNIEDTLAPSISLSEDTFDINSNIDLNNLIKITDASKFDYTIDGTVDSSKVGEYEVRVKASDEVGNETQSTLTITIKDLKAEEAEKQAQQNAVQEEDMMDEAESKVYDYLALYYPQIDVGVDDMLQCYVTNMGTEYIVQFPCSLEDDSRHQIVAYVQINNGQVGEITRIVMDGSTQIK